jgi:hypothetical protein
VQGVWYNVKSTYPATHLVFFDEYITVKMSDQNMMVHACSTALEKQICNMWLLWRQNCRHGFDIYSLFSLRDYIDFSIEGFGIFVSALYFKTQVSSPVNIPKDQVFLTFLPKGLSKFNFCSFCPRTNKTLHQ